MPANFDINMADEMGFCGGVRQAIKKAKQACKKYGRVQMLGDIVHNENVVQELAAEGVQVVDSLGTADQDIPLLFRAHGTPVGLWKQAQEMGFQIIDATCPLVKEIHDYAKVLEKENRTIFIIGDKGHDEVNGIASQVENPLIIEEIEDVPDQRYPKAGIVIQSTQNIDKVKKIAGRILENSTDLKIYNTICKPTRNRQVEVKKLAQENDLIIIIGSFTSANTKRLVKVAKAINPGTYQVEGPQDLKQEWFKDIHNVGLSAGASTPDHIIEEVRRKITLF